MFTIHIEMPSGARSRALDQDTEELAIKTFQRYVDQMTPWKGFTCDVVLTTEGEEVMREHITHAA
jgi:hypothetical protein